MAPSITTGPTSQTVIEGQAEAVMLQYALAPVGRSILDSPELVDAMESTMINGTPDSTVFRDAPIFLKESLTFPYSYGMEFVLKLMKKGGKEKAFAAVLQNPPHTTRQIMEPDTYLSGEKIEPMRVPQFARDFKNYQKFDIGAMGEFDVAVLIEQYAGRWRILLRRKAQDRRGGAAGAALCVALVDCGESVGVRRNLLTLAGTALQEGGRNRRRCTRQRQPVAGPARVGNRRRQGRDRGARRYRIRERESGRRYDRGAGEGSVWKVISTNALTFVSSFRFPVLHPENAPPERRQ